MPVWMQRYWVYLQLTVRRAKEPVLGVQGRLVLAKPSQWLLEAEPWQSVQAVYYAKLLARRGFEQQILRDGSVVVLAKGAVLLPASVLLRLGDGQEQFRSGLIKALASELKKNRGHRQVRIEGAEKMPLAVRKPGRCGADVEHDKGVGGR
jgi:hypothetical protein